MNAFEINKIVGAVLTTVLVAFIFSVAGNIFVPEGGAEGGKHAPAGVTATGAGARATKTPPKPETPLANLLAQASAEAGKLVAKKCLACHSLTKGGANKIGPNLYGIVGRDKGGYPGYKYSSGMKGAGGAWSYADLNTFLKKPNAFIKGTKMLFRIAKPEARANLLRYLRTLSDSPAPLPPPAPAASGGDKQKKAEPVVKTMEEKKPAEAPKQKAKPAAISLAAGDAARGAKLAARKCKVCHSLKAGGPNKIGPTLYGVIGRARASHEGYRYSKAMKAKGGAWNLEDIDVFLANPGKFIKGTKMAIKIKRSDQRADIIAYLKTLSGK